MADDTHGPFHFREDGLANLFLAVGALYRLLT